MKAACADARLVRAATRRAATRNTLPTALSVCRISATAGNTMTTSPQSGSAQGPRIPFLLKTRSNSN